MEETEKMSPELSDIIEMIQRYCIANKNEVSFVWSFLCLKKDTEHKCVDCGEDCDEIDNEKSRFGAYGDLFNLRILLNELRDHIEDEKYEEDEEGFINI